MALLNDAAARRCMPASSSGRGLSQCTGCPCQVQAQAPVLRLQRSQPQRGGPAYAIKDVAGVLVFSALPFLSVQALADSDLGKRLRANIDDNKPKFKQEQQEKERACQQARADSMWYGPERPRWLGPLSYSYPQHLRGDAPGDYGYDIASLAEEPADFDRYFNYEILHGRWAMLGALGALVPEVLQLTGLSNFSESRWWNVGYAKLQGEDLNYFGVQGLRIAGGQGIAIICICQVLLMFGPEYARSCGPAALEPLGLYLPGDENYPGGVFDPLGLSQDAGMLEELRVKEIKHARLSMVAWVGFAAQAAVTQKGPLENLLDFCKDPHKNVFTYLGRR